MSRERRDERRTQRAFREQIANEIRQSKCDDERVHVVAGAEQGGKHLLADEPENPAGERGGGGNTGGSREALSGTGHTVRTRRGHRAASVPYKRNRSIDTEEAESTERSSHRDTETHRISYKKNRSVQSTQTGRRVQKELAKNTKETENLCVSVSPWLIHLRELVRAL